MINTSLLSRYTGILAAAALIGLLAAPAAHAQFGTNRLLNGDAESSVGSSDGNFNGAPANWTVTAGNFTAVKYTAPGSPTPTAAQGLNYFAGGEDSAFAAGLQNISITDVSSLVDAGHVNFDASGFFGGFAEQDDNAVLRLTFLSSTNTSLGVVTLGGVTPAERGDVTSILFRQLTGAVPVGARTIATQLEMTRVEGNYDDGYADNLSVKLVNTSTVVPEAGTLALALPALGMVGTVVLRRRKK